jgi:3-hydroxybutyryl-CoA dehydrogenase
MGQRDRSRGTQMEIGKVGIVGAGTMGHGIAQVCAVAGLEVVMRDVSDEALVRGMAGIEKGLARLVERSRLDQAERDRAIARIATSTDVTSLAAVDLVIEAATENPELKLQVFSELDAICATDAVLASNTSSISLTRIAGATSRPGQVIGMHFFNPVPVMSLVEIIRALQTTDETFAAADGLARRLGKTPVSVQDSPGFVVNRMLVPMINEAAFALAEGLASAEEIDTAMKLGANHPMGPLALADLIGIDVCLYVMEVLHQQYADSKYRPCPLLRKMVDAGYLGRKSGRGFHSYG